MQSNAEVCVYMWQVSGCPQTTCLYKGLKYNTTMDTPSVLLTLLSLDPEPFTLSTDGWDQTSALAVRKWADLLLVLTAAAVEEITAAL